MCILARSKSTGLPLFSIIAGLRLSSPYVNCTTVFSLFRTVASYRSERSSRAFIKRRAIYPVSAVFTAVSSPTKTAESSPHPIKMTECSFNPIRIVESSSNQSEWRSVRLIQSERRSVRFPKKCCVPPKICPRLSLSLSLSLSLHLSLLRSEHSPISFFYKLLVVPSIYYPYFPVKFPIPLVDA